MQNDKESSPGIHVKAWMIGIVVMQVQNEIVDKETDKVDNGIDAVTTRQFVALC